MNKITGYADVLRNEGWIKLMDMLNADVLRNEGWINLLDMLMY